MKTVLARHPGLPSVIIILENLEVCVNVTIRVRMMRHRSDTIYFCRTNLTCHEKHKGVLVLVHSLQKLSRGSQLPERDVCNRMKRSIRGTWDVLCKG